MSKLEELRDLISADVQKNFVLAPLTAFKIGGPAEFYVEAKKSDIAVQAVKAARKLELSTFFLGGGSNTLISDEGIKGLVIRLTNDSLDIDGPVAVAGAGLPSGRLASATGQAGLTGLEWMVGLPGTVGGAVCGNAGMFGGEIKDNLEAVLALDPEGKAQSYSNQACGFAYRHSEFKNLPGTVILSASFRLEQADPKETQEKMRGFLKHKNMHQPVHMNTAGCVFKNWKFKNQEELDTVRKDLDLNKDEEFPITPMGTVPTGWIIDRAQLKGMKVGHCQVSMKHANFIISDGQGTASDVIALTSAIKMKIRDMTHGIILLEDEIIYAGF